MPFMDGTGPFGLGPGTGRRQGWCWNSYGSVAPCYPGGRGRGMRGYARQKIFGPDFDLGPIALPEITPEEKKTFLEAEKKLVEKQLAAIEKKLENLEKNNQ